jgi:hypothetical protein
MTKTVPWKRLDLSKELNSVGISPLPEDGNRSSFRKVVIIFLAHPTIDKVQSPINSEILRRFPSSNLLLRDKKNSLPDLNSLTLIPFIVKSTKYLVQIIQFLDPSSLALVSSCLESSSKITSFSLSSRYSISQLHEFSFSPAHLLYFLHLFPCSVFRMFKPPLSITRLYHPILTPINVPSWARSVRGDIT